TQARTPSSSRRFVSARAVRFPKAARTVSAIERSFTFWWIVFSAKRAPACAPQPSHASTSSAFDAASARSRTALASASPIGIGRPDLHLPEPRGRRAVARAHRLPRLALAAVRDAPEHPLREPADA